MTTAKFKVISLGIGSREDQTKYQLDYKESCYRVQLERTGHIEKLNSLDFIPKDFVIIAREPQPMIGDTYTLTFTKDEKPDGP